MQIPDDILAILRGRAETDGNTIRLGGDRLDPRLYQRTNEVLEGAGGKWTKSVQAHVFPGDAGQTLASVLAAGQVVTLREKRNDAQYFPTPPAVVDRLIALARLEPGVRVLEPSAGSGAIANAVRDAGATVDCIERDPGYAATLTEAGHEVRVTDFLAVPAEPRYARVVMNPPFTRQADIAHVRHALGFLKSDGLLVAVMSHTTAYHRGAASFRHLVAERGGTVEPLPEGAFKGSDTGVKTLVVTIPATRPDGDVPAPTWPGQQPAQPEAEDKPQLDDPAAIAREMQRNLRTALREISALARLLEQPHTSSDDGSDEEAQQLSLLDLPPAA